MKSHNAVSRTLLIAIVVIIIIVIAVAAIELMRPSKPTQSVILIGTLYASTGSFASTSMPEYEGLLLWAKTVNASGGIYVSSLGKKLPVRIIAYDDSSETSLASQYYEQLITVNHVNFLVADFGSVLTAPAVSIAEKYGVLLFDVTGSSEYFFSPPSPYIVLTSIPGSPAYGSYVAPFLKSINATRVAILYGENDFDAALASVIVNDLKAEGITPIYYQGYPTSTTDFSTLITTLQSLNPQVVLEIGYPNNDIAFLNQLHSMGVHFNLTLTIFPGQLWQVMLSSVGNNMAYTYTLLFPPLVNYTVNYGPTLSQFEQEWNATYPGTPVSYLSIAGFTAGLIIQKAIEAAGSLNATAVRQAINSFSGKITTIDGPFMVNATNGMQLGEVPLVGQIVPTPSGLQTVVVYPPNLATGKAIYPAPG
jgi:branched-chain amino acid transport system substrate-binding protein